jgi:hypothetical protein
MKEYIKGNIKFIVIKNEKGLYDYQSQEYSEICGTWVNTSKQKNFTRVALEDWLDIKIDF